MPDSVGKYCTSAIQAFWVAPVATIHQLFIEDLTDEAVTSGNDVDAEPRMSTHILALTNNATLLDIIHRAAPRGTKVVDADNLETMLSSVYSLRPGILIIDSDCCNDISRIAIQLLQELPELVLVAAGASEESGQLMKLAAAGHIYRFMLKPLAHAQTRLTLEAALHQHDELLANANRSDTASIARKTGHTEKNYLPTYIGLGLALAVVAGAAFYGLSRLGNNEHSFAALNITSAGLNSTANKELDIADAAFASSKLLNPPGESALDLYRSALAIDPENVRAKAGIENVASKLLEQAEVAMTAEQLEAAVVVMEQARDISPNNTRLKFLDSQLARERERLKLTQGQDLSRKVRTLLAQAQANMDAGRLITPAENNARTNILDARRFDATDPGIAQAQRSLSTLLIEATRHAVEQNQLDLAQSYLSAARQLGSAGADLSAAERILNSAMNSSGSNAAVSSHNRSEVSDTPATPQKITVPAQSEHDATVSVATVTSKAVEAQPAATTGTTVISQSAVPLKRIKTVSPIFPDSARSRGTSGWVEVAFTVDETGKVAGATVSDAQPKGIFDAAALTAVNQWRFDPPLRDGKPVSQLTKVRLRFDLSR